MSAAWEKQNTRFDLVSAGHRFLFQVLPFQRPASNQALDTFILSIDRSQAPPFEIDTVLIRCLAVLGNGAAQLIPSLVDQYLQDSAAQPADLGRFAACIERVLRFRSTSDGVVQDAIQLISERFATPGLSPRVVAEALDKRLSTLDVSFKAQTGSTLTEYIRAARLEQAAALLATSNKSIKEVWAEVGYMHHSNFDHDFKRKFGRPPRAYRAQSIRPVAHDFYSSRQAEPNVSRTRGPAAARLAPIRVLIIDADESSRILADYLNLQGHSSLVAHTVKDVFAVLDRERPHTIFLEYRLIDADAIDLLRRVREHPNGGFARAIIFTAEWDAFEQTNQFNALNAVVVSKLCDPQVVSEFVTAQLQTSHVSVIGCRER